MRRKMQKGLSLLLSATMAFGVAATPVAAAEETGVPEGGAGVTAALPAEDAGSEATSAEETTPTEQATPAPTEETTPTDEAPEAPETSPAATEEPVETQAPAETAAPEATATPTPSAEPEATATPTPSASPEATATPAPSAEPEASATPAPSAKPRSTEELADIVSRALGNSTFTVDPSAAAANVQIGEIHPNEMILTDEQIAEVENSDDPILKAVRNELSELVIEGGEAYTEAAAANEAAGIAMMAEGDASEETKQPLSEEQITQVLAMFQQYLDYWEANENVLGLQLPFYLNSNDNGEDGLGILGQMLILANVPLEDVRDGSYSYDDLTGMIMNFQYGDQLGVEYYKDDIIAKAEEAMAAVEASGAQTEAQKLLELNTWLAQHNTFDMSYIMNQMDPENPLMVAPDPVEHEHQQEVYNELVEAYTPIITNQINTQIEEAATQMTMYLYAVSTAEGMKYMAENDGATEEEMAAHVQEFMAANTEAILADSNYLATNYPEYAETAISVATQYIASEEGQKAVADTKATLMDTPMEDLGGLTPNDAIDVYIDQAAQGLTTGVLGYWEGNHIGALASGASVCMGYAKAFAYLVQYMHPEIYGTSADANMSDATQWKGLDDGIYVYDEETGNVVAGEGTYVVDMVRITFQAAVTMYGETQPDFSSDHFWNAVKVDGKWYYVDPCYTDVWSEVMMRDRVETDGAMNHTYFLVSDNSLRNMLDGNYDAETGIRTLYEDLADNTDYEDSWIARVNSNVYSDGSYFYYTYSSTDLITMMEEYNSSEGNFQDMDLENYENPDLKIVRHQITGTDAGTDGDTNYETLIDFTSGDSVQVLQDGKPTENEMLTELYNQFVTEQDIYPSISITPVYYNGKVYFNLSNCILSYDIATGDVAKVKEYNTVYTKRDDTVAFGAMAFDMVNSAEEANFTFQNHPIAGMALKDDGQLYVDIATNLSYIAGRDPHDYTDPSSFGYEFEETNYDPNYNSYASSMAGDNGDFDYGDIMDQMGYEQSINDNDEFMWVANVVGTMEMAHFAGSSHTYGESKVSVDAFCGHNAYTEYRCTTCGAIQPDTRVEEEGTAPAHHHYILVNEEYYTKDDNENWNTGSSYVCTMCGYSISEPTEPKENQWEDEEDYQARLEEYKVKKAIYDEAVEVAGHTYVPTDPVWTEDGTGVNFTSATCQLCANGNLDIFAAENSLTSTEWGVTVSNAQDYPATPSAVEGSCDTGATVTYTASGELPNGTFTVSTKVEKEPGAHAYALESDSDLVWTAITDEDGVVTGYTATATLVCSVCGDKRENVEGEVVLDEENSYPATEEEDGKNVYNATFTVTDESGKVLGTYSAQKEDILDALNKKYTGLRKDDDGVWRYYTDGVFDSSKTGVVMYGDNTWFYVTNGVLDVEFAGFVPYNGAKFYVSAGQVRTDLTQLVKDPNGDDDDWYYISSGQVREDTNGRVWYNDHFFWLTKGKLDTSVNGFIEEEGEGTYYLSYGQYQTDMTGLVKDPHSNNWYYISSGKVREDFSNLVLYNDNWFVISKGVLDVGFNGLYEYNGHQYLCKDGQMQKDFVGTYEENGRTYNIRYGMVV